MRKNFHSESLYWVVKNVLPSNLLMNVRAVDGALHAILLFPFFIIKYYMLHLFLLVSFRDHKSDITILLRGVGY